MYIAFEGIDTAGKSTQLQLLSQKIDAFTTKEPGGSDLGRSIREIVLHQKDISKEAEVLLFLADRAEHIAKTVAPNIEKTILSDRSLVSNIAYAMANGFNYELLKQLNLFATKRILPNTVFIFKLNKQTLRQRLSSKSHDKIEQRGIDYLLEVQDNLIYTTKKLQLNHHIIDATQEIEEIHEQVLKAIENDKSS
ncbi:MAG: dTMP kinase [Campylobacterota bacterium]